MKALTPEARAAKLFDDAKIIVSPRETIAAAIREAVAAEREACAKLVDSWKGRRLKSDDPDSEVNKAFGRGIDMAAHYIAAGIRDRSIPPDASTAREAT